MGWGGVVAGLALNSPSESGAALRILDIEAFKFRIILTLNIKITFEISIFARFRIRISYPDPKSQKFTQGESLYRSAGKGGVEVWGWN